MRNIDILSTAARFRQKSASRSCVSDEIRRASRQFLHDSPRSFLSLQAFAPTSLCDTRHSALNLLKIDSPLKLCGALMMPVSAAVVVILAPPHLAGRKNERQCNRATQNSEFLLGDGFIAIRRNKNDFADRAVGRNGHYAARAIFTPDNRW